MEIPCDFDSFAFTKSVEASLRLRESSCFDLCSFDNLLAASCDQGFLRLHHIERSLRAEDTKQATRYSAVVDVGVAPFLSMCSGVVNNTPLLIGGGQQRVFGYRWETLSNYFDAAMAESGASRFIELQPELGFDCAYFSSQSPVQISPADINMMAIDQNAGHVYAASGTGDVYVCDLEGQRLAGVLSGSYHNSYVHCVSVNAATGLVTSGDEDGCVCVWDTRTKAPVIRYDVAESVKQTSVGDAKCYVAGAHLDDSGNFLICAGGADTSTGMVTKGPGWITSLHLKTLTPVAAVATPAPIQELTILPGGDIVTGGLEGCIRYHSFPTLTQTSTTAVSPRSVFCVRHLSASSVSATGDEVVLAVGGSSPYIDVFLTRGYKSMSLLPHIPQH